MIVDLSVQETGRLAKEAFQKIKNLTRAQKDKVLLEIADALDRFSADILFANQKDLDDAEKSGLSAAMLERLSIQNRIPSLIEGILQVASLPDPVGEVFESSTLPNGLKLQKVRIPIGVIGVIYESRPNVTLDVAAIALKTGNCVILRGGSETITTNAALCRVVQWVLESNGLPANAVQLIATSHREEVAKLLRLDEYVDLIIPRGGEGLHRYCKEVSTIPVITGGIGICHLYLEKTANLEASIEVVYNAKTQRPTVCNALDTLLVDREAAADFLPPIIERLLEAGVTFRLDPSAFELLYEQIDNSPGSFSAAQEEDYRTEWLSLILGIKIVDSPEEAIQHIKTYSTSHSDGILTNNYELARHFISEIDSAVVYVNASTRFTDGGEFGLGAEVAVSTQKIHARGPMGLKELTTYKWVCEGNYHVRS